jgi:hypothetical protein
MGNHLPTIQCIVNKLKLDFALKDLGSLSYFLGIQATRNSASLHLRQSKYILDLLDRTKISESKPYPTPCLTSFKMSRFDGEPLANPTAYRHIVGALQYVTLARPNIAYSVNQLCQHMHSPTSTHLTAAKRVLRYLKGSIDYGLQYHKCPLAVTTYCDSNWTSNLDDRRSTTGFDIYLGSNLISWLAKKQHTVFRSSTEAKYRAFSLATVEMFWLRMLLKKLQVFRPSPHVLRCDNSGALTLAYNPIHHARTKHIEVDIHFVREKVNNRDIELKHLSTLDQVADIFTKGHTVARFCYLRDKLMVVPPMSLQGGVEGKATHKLHTQQQAVCSATQANQLVHSQPREDILAHSQPKESNYTSPATNSPSSSVFSANSSPHNSFLKKMD